MSAYLLTGLDTARLGSLAVAVNDGTDSGTATVAAGTYAHRDLSSVMGSGEYTDLATALGTALDAVISAGMTVTWSSTTLLYTISHDDSTATSLDFTSTAGQRLAAALGFTADHSDGAGTGYSVTLSGASSYTSNVTPYYALALAKAGPAKYSQPFEVAGQVKRQVSVKANAYSVAPTTLEKRVKFALLFNTLASVFSSKASASVPWTYEDLVAHARCWEPTLLSYSAEDLVYKDVRGTFDEDARQSVWQDYQARWNLTIEGQYLGSL